jgi:chemotaxis signal transduction protein
VNSKTIHIWLDVSKKNEKLRTTILVQDFELQIIGMLTDKVNNMVTMEATFGGKQLEKLPSFDSRTQIAALL